MTLESMTAVISSSVAEKALCWCEGRKRRRIRAKPRTGRASGESAEFAIKGRFYTQTFRSPDTPYGSYMQGKCGAGALARRLCPGLEILQQERAQPRTPQPQTPKPPARAP